MITSGKSAAIRSAGFFRDHPGTAKGFRLSPLITFDLAGQVALIPRFQQEFGTELARLSRRLYARVAGNPRGNPFNLAFSVKTMNHWLVRDAVRLSPRLGSPRRFHPLTSFWIRWN
jgi:hypothetical protein